MIVARTLIATITVLLAMAALDQAIVDLLPKPPEPTPARVPRGRLRLVQPPQAVDIESRLAALFTRSIASAVVFVLGYALFLRDKSVARGLLYGLAFGIIAAFGVGGMLNAQPLESVEE